MTARDYSGLPPPISPDAFRAMDGDRCARVKELSWMLVAYAVRLGEASDRQYSRLGAGPQSTQINEMRIAADQLALILMDVTQCLAAFGHADDS
jgi:hypothetical protein